MRLVEFPAGRWLLAEDVIAGCTRDAATTANRQVLLTNHNIAVGELAETYAKLLKKLPKQYIAALAQAGRLHDLAKAHPLFQRFRLGNRGSEILAKSSRRGDPKWEYRHEAVSVSMAANGEKTTALSRHLIGTHHGDGRPHFRPENQSFVGAKVCFTQDGRVYAASDLHGYNALDSQWRSNFLELEAKHSTWGLAYLEAILRFADWNISAIETAAEATVKSGS